MTRVKESDYRQQESSQEKELDPAAEESDYGLVEISTK